MGTARSTDQGDDRVPSGRGSGRGHRVATTKVRGRMSAAKHDVLVRLGPVLGLDDRPGEPLGAQLDRVFGRRAPLLLDIGGGSGDATVAWAEEHLDHDVVAVELHRPSVAATLRAVAESGLTNVRVAEVDGRALLERAVPGDLAAVRLLFPDPWPKRRQQHRRLVDAGFVARVGDLLAPGGILHVATDWDGYAEAVRAALTADGRFALQDADGATGTPRSSRPMRPVTAYERVALTEGRTITDLVATRTAGPGAR